MPNVDAALLFGLFGGACLTALAVLLAWAAYGDVKRYMIPNRISIAILAVYPLYVAATAFLPSFYPSINCLGVTSMVTFLPRAGAPSTVCVRWSIARIRILVSTVSLARRGAPSGAEI